MKVICTADEKVELIQAIRKATNCVFLHRAKKCEEMIDCNECIEKSVEWQIEEGDIK